MGRRIGGFLWLVLFCLFLPEGLQAQVTREADVTSIAGLLDGDGLNEFVFRAAVGQVLFADIDGSLYQTRGTHEHEETEGLAAAQDEGCADEDECSDEGGSGQFCLQVVLDDEVLCWAGRPAPPPGWQRDPRLACVLDEAAGDYVLRVFRTSVEGGCADAANAHPPEPGRDPWPYLLNLSLRSIAPEGRIQPAIGQGSNRF